MTQSQNKPNNLAELDKRVADAKAAEGQTQQQGPANAPAQPQPDAVKV
ncbi:hypothetical protein [Ferrovibrio sp.]|nr:hypothetical protein [Ferrovibrio sp.]